MVRLSGLHGALVVDKPRGMTSHDVVAKARKALGTRAIGHAGTLDPMATGVLVLLVGEALKLSSYVTQDDKRYRATVSFGVSTDSDDAEGQVVQRQELEHGWLDPARLRDAIQAERARSTQIPPAFSAIHVDGERAHRLSRQGRPPSLAPRAVRVLDLELEHADDRSATFVLHVSKGYYVRSFARDLGAALGVPAHLSALRRLSSGKFSLSDASEWPLPGAPRLLSLAETAARALPTLPATAEGARRARLGQPLHAEHLAAPPPESPSEHDTYALFAPEGQLVALARPTAGGVWRVARGILPV